jgi:hypothetical protein
MTNEHAVFVQGTKEGGNVAEDCQFNPAVSEKQRRFMGAELARKRAGEQTETGMTEQQLREFARR